MPNRAGQRHLPDPNTLADVQQPFLEVALSLEGRWPHEPAMNGLFSKASQWVFYNGLDDGREAKFPQTGDTHMKPPMFLIASAALFMSFGWAPAYAGDSFVSIEQYGARNDFGG